MQHSLFVHRTHIFSLHLQRRTGCCQDCVVHALASHAVIHNNPCDAVNLMRAVLDEHALYNNAGVQAIHSVLVLKSCNAVALCGQ